MTYVEEKSEKIQDIVDMVNLSDISSIKRIVTAIIRVTNNPKSTVKELKEVILLDPPMVAKVLRTANSAYYSHSFTHIFYDIEQAIIWLGSEIVKELALSQKVCEIFNKDEKIEEYSRISLWRHSVAVALLAKMIYRKEFGQKGENAYVAGLLHDIGIIAEDQFFQKDFKRALELSKAKNISFSKAEFEVWGYDHAELGESIIHSWGLPEELTIAIGYHHNPLEFNNMYERIISTLHVADYLCQANGFSYGVLPSQDKTSFQRCLTIIDVKPYALEIIFNCVKEEISRMEDKGLL